MRSHESFRFEEAIKTLWMSIDHCLVASARMTDLDRDSMVIILRTFLSFILENLFHGFLLRLKLFVCQLNIILVLGVSVFIGL